MLYHLSYIRKGGAEMTLRLKIMHQRPLPLSTLRRQRCDSYETLQKPSAPRVLLQLGKRNTD